MKKLRKMVVGLVFDATERYVLLIEKQRPDWQKGFYNGIGGHIEKTDHSTFEAMVREFKEETGVTIPSTKWRCFAKLTHPSRGGFVYFFVAKTDKIYNAKSKTDEVVRIFFADVLPENIRPNLRWLIPMALDTSITVPIDVEDRGKN